MRARLTPLTINMVAIAFIGGMSGCSRRTPVATVVLVDPSASVTEVARKEEFDAVAALVPKMQRGDSLTIIPITDNAAADIQGHVLRLRASERREAYDADLRRFRVLAGQQYSAFAANLLAHPGQRTDILGALDVARQEFDAIPGSDRRRIIVLSDFLEDDGTYQFATECQLRNCRYSRRFARRLLKAHGFALHGVSIYLGELDSSELGNLDTQRQNAVQTFWSTYFGEMEDNPEIQFDGTGVLGRLGG